MADNSPSESKHLSTSIVTPDGTVYHQDDVDMAVLDTLAGQIGIMANHIPLVVALRISQ
ncbi:hypothetical protein Q757_07290, partial [Oenococcus alcoholitolerans]